MVSDREREFLILLNQARADPAAYGRQVGVDLSYIAPAPPLAFHPTLQDVAAWRTADMDARNYFGHQDPWTQELMAAGRARSLWFPMGEGIGESIAAGDRPAAAQLFNLVVDAGIPSLGHRHHLLGHGWTSTHRHAGVSFFPRVTGFYSGYFCCVTGLDPAAVPAPDPTPTGSFGTPAASGGDVAGYPAPVAVVTTAPRWTWAADTTDTRGVPVVVRQARCWYGNSFTLTLPPDLRAGAVYCCDWDAGGRVQKLELVAADDGEVLGAVVVRDFVAGVAVPFTVPRPAHLRVTRLAGANAVVSAVASR